jgi:hypothetical protein
MEVPPEDLLSPGEAAKIAGTSGARIGQMRKQVKWQAMFIEEKVYVHHALWKQYLADRQAKGELPSQKPVNDSQEPQAFQGVPTPSIDSSVSIAAPGPSELTQAKIKKTQEEAAKAEIQRRKLEGELVPFEIMDRLVFDYFENLNRRLLHLPNNLVDRILQLAIGSGQGARAKCVEIMINEIGRELKETKQDIINNLEKYKEQL